MACFSAQEADWQRLDFATIVGEGFVPIRTRDCAQATSWLADNGYLVEQVDCGTTFKELCVQFGQLFKWEEQFGYRYEDGKGNLDALRDGFEFAPPEDGGAVLWLKNFEQLWQSDKRWASALLEIAAEHTRYQIAFGKRFFTVVEVADDSSLPGAAIAGLAMPAAWRPSNEGSGS